jgi:small subunit ribosomal protein S6
MPEATPTYDLTLLLSMKAPDDQRAKIVADTENAISGADGSIERKDEWGTRPLTYRIRHETEAEYHLIQFTGPPSLLESLAHTLRITDGVLRHRIIKVLPGTPPAPESAPPVVASAIPAAATAGPAASGATAATATATAAAASSGSPDEPGDES